MATVRAATPGLRDKVAGYVALTKPRIIELLLVTTVPTMVLAEGGVPPLTLVIATVVGGTLAAGGANAFNMYVDRDIDRLMERTRGRPLVTGVVSERGALVFAAALEVVAFLWLWGLVNLISAVLALSATAFYVFVYTLWLKRTSEQNIVIGGAAGAVPVLVGWAAVRGTLAPEPLVLFALIFVWTPPHFWALAFKYADDYRAAGVPMLPAVADAATTTRNIGAYTVATVATSAVFGVVADMGPVYWLTAGVAGVVFCVLAVRLHRRPAPGPAMRLFGWSITYLALIFAAIAADVIVRSGW